MVRFLFRIILAIVLTFCVVGAVSALFGADRPATVVVSQFSWSVVADTSGDQIACWRGDTQVGTWRVSTQEYFPRFGPGDWGKPCNPPVDVPTEYIRAVTNYGVDTGKIGGGEHWRINGREVDREEATREIEAPAIPDDSGLPFVVGVGLPDDQGKQLAADAAGKARVQLYAANDVMIADRNGKPVYTPGLWFVLADGTVVAHEPAYTGAAQLAEGLRLCDPSWNPLKVPDLSAANPVIAPGAVTDAAAVIGTGAGLGSVLGLVALLFKRKVSTK